MPANFWAIIFTVPPLYNRICSTKWQVASFILNAKIFKKRGPLKCVEPCTKFCPYPLKTNKKVWLRTAAATTEQLWLWEPNSWVFLQLLALGAKLMGIPATIVMPGNAPGVKKNAVESYGAQIVECEPTLEARENTLAGIISKTLATPCHPYNDRAVILGNSTATQEILEEMDVDAIISPVGGGGLISGTALAAHFFSKKTVVYGAEPQGAADAFHSIQLNSIQPSINPKTIADGLRTSLGDQTFPVIRDYVKEIFLVDDYEILFAMKLIWERLKIVVESSSAIVLAAVLKNKQIFQNQKVALILSGGNVDLNAFFNLEISKL